jgi:phosphatidylserine/phosphatidylglycerophosphate/cardiolipin synthase-like enzyme
VAIQEPGNRREWTTMMKIDLVYVVACALACVLAGCHPAAMKMGGYPDFEVVESIPKETVLDNPGVRNTHEVWLEMIGSAAKSIDLEQFYVSSQKGEALDDILSALVAAANRGVQIRFIIDARMHKTYPEPIDSIGRLKNISVRVIDFGKLTGGIQHAKYFIVDGREIFLGSQNFDWRALDHIHEIGVRIRNAPALVMYKEVFETDWQLAGGKTREEALVQDRSERPILPFRVVEGERDTLVFEPTMSPKGLIPDSEQWDERKIVELLDGAKREAMVQVLTYSPVERVGGRYTVLDSALRRAASRGVAV